MAVRGPIVILPGYYGTLLVDTAANRRTIWLTLASLVASGKVLDAINLETGVADRIVSGEILDEFHILGHWAPNFYKDLRLFLGTLGYAASDIIGFGTDWRRTLDFNVDQLHAKLGATGKATLIGHSHGGLVVRAYLAKHGPDLVDRFITFGTPHKGMLDTFQALVEGVRFFGWSKSHLRDTARTFPSAFELLPQDAADGMFEWKGASDDPFANDAWIEDALKPKLANARGVVTALPSELPVRTTIIYGTHNATIAKAIGDANGKLSFKTEPAGDGTVPSVSGLGTGLTGPIERYAIPYGNHAHLFAHPAAQRLLRSVLLDEPAVHFATAFSREMYLRGERLGVAVDVRGPHGEELDADVRIDIGGKKLAIPRESDAGDYFVKLKMPATPEHLEYTITAESAGLPQKQEVKGILHPLNV